MEGRNEYWIRLNKALCWGSALIEDIDRFTVAWLRFWRRLRWVSTFSCIYKCFWISKNKLGQWKAHTFCLSPCKASSRRTSSPEWCCASTRPDPCKNDSVIPTRHLVRFIQNWVLVIYIARASFLCQTCFSHLPCQLNHYRSDRCFFASFHVLGL